MIRSSPSDFRAHRPMEENGNFNTIISPPICEELYKHVLQRSGILKGPNLFLISSPCSPSEKMKFISLIGIVSLTASVLGQPGVGTKCHADGLKGICQNTASFCEGWYQPGHCPGPANVRPRTWGYLTFRCNVALRQIVARRFRLILVIGRMIQDARIWVVIISLDIVQDLLV